MQIKQGQNNVTQNTPIDPTTGFAEVGDSASAVLLTIDRTGHVVLAESVPIPNIPNGQITLSGNPTDVVNGEGDSVPISSLLPSNSQNIQDTLSRLVIKHDGTVPYNHEGYALVKQGT